MGWAGNTSEELSVLVGATILGFEIIGIADPVRLHVRYRDGLIVNGAREGFYEVWQDEEGNGPGCLALVGHGKEVDVQEENAVS